MKIFFVLLFLLFAKLHCSEPCEFALITLMKSGTHMTKDLLVQLTDKEPLFVDTNHFVTKGAFTADYLPGFFNIVSTYKSSNRFAYSHTPMAFPFSEYAKQNPDFLLITNYRDLRDAAVSLAHYLDEIGVYKEQFPKSQLSFDEKLHISITKLMKQVKRNMKFINQTENLFIVRFEDLVGAKGGGSDVAQYELVTNLCKALKIKIRPGKIKTILETLYGSSGTFRKGVIGEWKKSFKEEHKVAFKEGALGAALIEMGYETGFDW